MNKTLYGFLGVVLVGLLLWGGLAWHDRNLLKQLRAEMSIARRDTSIASLDSARIVRDTVYLRGRTVFREIASNPSSTKPQIIKACSDALDACDVVRATNDSLRDSLKAQVKALRGMKSKKPPRLSLFGMAGYDFVNKQSLGRAGADFRIIGPVSITGEVEALPQSDLGFKSRAVAGIRFTFR